MSNLLPEIAKSQIRSEYRARFVLSGSMLAIGTALFTMLALSPSYVVLLTTRPAAKAEATAATQSKTDAADLARAQALSVQFAQVSNASSSVTDVIARALSERPSGVHIDDISYSPGTKASVTIAGAADNRETIDKYRNTLQADPVFASVKLPVGDLIGNQGGRFTITLTGHF